MLNAILLTACLLASFLLSGMEAGVFALNRLRIRRLARAGRADARRLNRFLEQPERFLWTILVGNTLANFFILAWVLATLNECFPQRTALTAGWFALLVFGFYACLDLLPKMLFRAHPNSLCLAAARPFRLIHFLLSPLVSLVETASGVLLRLSGGEALPRRLFGNREELRAVMQESGRGLTADERTMIERIMDLQHLTVDGITKTWAETVAVESTQSLREAIALAAARRVSRLPVWESREGRRRVAGVLEVGSLLYREDLDRDQPVSGHMISPVFLTEGARLETALRQLQRARQSIGIVLSRDRQELGIVTLKDLLRVMFGEIKL